jgi:hypothetical protein
MVYDVTFDAIPGNPVAETLLSAVLSTSRIASNNLRTKTILNRASRHGWKKGDSFSACEIGENEVKKVLLSHLRR